MSLKIRQDRHRCEGQGCNNSFFGDDVQIAEQDVAHHLAVDFGDQRDGSKPASTQGIDQASLTILSECKAIRLANGVVVLFFLRPNKNRHGNERFARAHDDRPMATFRNILKVKARNDSGVRKTEGEAWELGNR